MLSRFGALLRKEFAELARNRQLLFLLLIPPLVQTVLFGVALKPIVKELSLAVADESKTLASRDLIAAFAANGVFVPRYVDSGPAVGRAVRAGHTDAGMVIPPEFTRDVQRGRTAEVQIVLDGVNAYVAGQGAGYTAGIVDAYDRAAAGATLPGVDPQITFAYNPGLISSWFFVPGIIGGLIVLTGIIAASAEAVREKDEGTLEQLLMTPASSWEILIAKIVPLFVMFLGSLCLGLTVAKLVFGLPLLGNIPLFLTISSVYILSGLGVGILIATYANTRQQVILISIFVALPLMLLSGAFAPIESMPPFFQYLTLLNPLRHYITIMRAMLLKGVGWQVVWPDAMAIVAFAVIAIAVSGARYRSQLS
ncbi:MAG: ABC transporter permease [Candidatus Baltobacteraceae bacterium]|jgi:ABC-2 type transport system permease protein